MYCTYVQGNEIKLWWPNGFGQQNLYPVQVLYTSNNYGETSKKVMNAGFRLVELVEDPIDIGNLSKGQIMYNL